jgi:beta-glucosidase
MTARDGGPPALDARGFVWAAGIEDTFIPQPARRTGRVLDEYELTQHYRFWREDLALAAEVGVTHMRYGIPWYRVNPAPGHFDWRWTDEVLEHMVRDVGITPIVDLMHYGCPLWLGRQFVDPDYPARVAEYAAAFVERYRSLTSWYTPLNEPLVNTRFAGYTGSWPPHVRGWRGYVSVLMGIAEGMSRTVAAIRSLQPDAGIVHVEATACHSADDPALADALAFTLGREFLPTDLLLGDVDEGHQMRPWLLANGADPAALGRLVASPQTFDVMGTNFYPGMSCHRLFIVDGQTRGRGYYGGVAEFEWVMRTYAERYGRPVMATETSTIGSVARRARWMDESIGLVGRLRADGVPVIGYTWWPLFSLITWRYRAGRGDLSEYLGHMGLWDLQPDADGVLLRVPTPLVDRFRRHVADWADEAAA